MITMQIVTLQKATIIIGIPNANDALTPPMVLFV
jgi:hypothetical protein